MAQLSHSQLPDDYFQSKYLSGYAESTRHTHLLPPQPKLISLSNSNGPRTDHLFRFEFDPLSVSTAYHGCGTYRVRKLVAEQYGVTEDHVCLITGGASAANFQAINTLLLHGGLAFVEFPRYDPLEGAIRVSNACNARQFVGSHPFYIHRKPENSFQPELSEISEILEKYSPRLLVFSHPHNPTGRKIDQIGELMQLVDRHNEKIENPKKKTYVLFDEVYLDLPNDGVVIPPGISYSKYAVSVTSGTKCYGVTGIGFGVVIADPSVTKEICCFVANGACTNTGVLEHLWWQFMQQRGGILSKLIDEREKRRSFIDQMFEKYGVEYVKPDAGSVYVIKVGKNKEETGDKFAELLKAQKQVSVVSGSMFECDDYVRIGYLSVPFEEVQEGVSRFCQFYVDWVKSRGSFTPSKY